MWTERLSVLLVSMALAAPVVGQPSTSDQDPQPEPPPVRPVTEEAEEEIPPRESFLSTSLTLGPARDSGFVVAGEEVDDTVYLVNPRLHLVQRPSERTEITIAYEPELQYFQDHQELDSVEHIAGLLFQHEASRRSSFLLGGSLLDGEDPGRHLAADLLVMPRSPYRQWRAYAGFAHRWARSFFLLNVGHTSTRVETAAGALASDQTDDTASLTLGRDLGPNTYLSANYSYLDPTFEPLEIEPTEPVEGEEPPIDEEEPDLLPRFVDPVQTLSLGLGHQVSSKLGYFVDAGVLYENEETLFIGGMEIVRSADAFSFRLRYDRSPLSLGPSLSAPGAVPGQPAPPSAGLRDAVSDTVGLSFDALPFDRLRWYQSLWGSRTDLADGATVDSFAVTSRLVLRIADRFGTFVQYQFLDQDGPELLGGDVSRSHAFAGLILGLTGPRGSWGIREEPEYLRTVLPGRRDF